MKGNFLYKYSHPDRSDILRSRRVRFTQPDALNDPFELRPILRALIDPDYAWKQIRNNPVDISPVVDEAYKQLPERIQATISPDGLKAAMAAQLENPDVLKGAIEYIEQGLEAINAMSPRVEKLMHNAFSRRIGILSLSEVADNELMWAHYANDHRGFVFVWDAGHPFFDSPRSTNDEFYRARRVRYRERSSIADFRQLDGETLFLTKGKEWSHEREWRVLAPLEDAEERITNDEGEDIFLFDIPPSALSGLVFGMRTSTAVKNDILKYLSTPPWDHLKVGWVTMLRDIGRLGIVWQ